MGWGGDNNGTKVKPTATERMSARVGALDYNDFQESFVPAEERLQSNVRATEGDLGQVSGIAAGDVEQAVAGQAKDITAGGLAAGANTNSSRAKLTLASLATDIGQARAAAAAAAQNQRKDAGLRGLGKISALGRGLADQSAINLRAEGARDTANAIDMANLKSQRVSVGTAATELGAGLAGTYAGYKLGQD